MVTHLSHKPHPHHDVAIDEPEPGMPPIQPDEGVVPPSIPADPEHDRLVDPEV